MIVFAFVQSLVYRVWLCPSNSKVLVSEKYEAATQVSLPLVSSLFPRKVSLVWLVKISAHLSFGYECKWVNDFFCFGVGKWVNELNLSLLLRSGGEWALHFWPITTLHSTSVGNPSVVVLYYIILYYIISKSKSQLVMILYYQQKRKIWSCIFFFWIGMIYD